MDQEYLEKLVERLLEQKNISAKEAIELLKLNQPQKEYISVPTNIYPYWEYRPYYPWITWYNTSDTCTISNANTSTTHV